MIICMFHNMKNQQSNEKLSLLQLFCSMSAAFTLNFFRSGINFNKWGSFQLPGLLNFGEFKVKMNVAKFCISCKNKVNEVVVSHIKASQKYWKIQISMHLTVHMLHFIGHYTRHLALSTPTTNHLFTVPFFKLADCTTVLGLIYNTEENRN